jgi:hypothetical protein
MAIADAVKRAPSLGGGAGGKSSSDYELDSSLIQHLLANSFLSRLQMCVEYVTPTASVKSSSARVDLRRPLYHPDMLVWAKAYRADLLRTEKKIFELLSDRSASSLQLKPMKKWSRDTVALLAKYYQLGAQEYSTLHKDDMYVSLVKTIDSCLPATALSAAADPPTGTGLSSTELLALLVEEIRVCVERREYRPQILFTVRRVGAGVTVGDFLCELKAVIETDLSREGGAPSGHHLTELACLGYSHLRLSFSSLSAALACHRVLLASSLNQKFHIEAYFTEDLPSAAPSSPPLLAEDQSPPPPLPQPLPFPREATKSHHEQEHLEASWRAASDVASPVTASLPLVPDKWDIAFQAARHRGPPPPVSVPPAKPSSVPELVVAKKAKKAKRPAAPSAGRPQKAANAFSALDGDSDSDSG